jgi:Peptidase family M23
MPQNPFNKEENLKSLFEQDDRYNKLKNLSKSKTLKTKFDLFSFIKGFAYTITHSMVYMAIFTLVIFTTVTASAQFAAPNNFKPTTFLCQKFSTCELSTGCPSDSVVVKPNQVQSKYIWPTTGCISRCLEQGHFACDIVNNSMPPVLSIAEGIVIQAYKNNGNGYGNTVQINHNNGITALYAHLNEIKVISGQTVKQGEAIGQMGNTGNSSETHLHIEIKLNGSSQNPLDYLAKP